MPRATCGKCKRFYRCKENDIRVEEGMPVKNEAGEEIWVSYKLWCADLWECPGCQHQLITGYGRGAYAEHHQSDYGDALKSARQDFTFFRINDC